MAYPWLVDETFDDGTRGGFDSETDASNILTFPHYKQLAGANLSPWQGAHALRLDLSGTATGLITETGGFDITVDGNISVWMPVLLAESLTLNDTDEVILLAIQSAGPVDEAVMGVRLNGTQYEFFAGETGATRTIGVTRNNHRWYQLEMDVALAAAGAGTIDFYVDGAQVGAQIGSLTHATSVQGQIGAVSGTAAGNSGIILIGGIIADDVRVFPRTRFPLDTVWITRDKTAFVGPGLLDAAHITGTSTDAVLTVLDTDIFESTKTNFTREPLVYVRNVTANDQAPGFNTPVKFTKGCYVQLTGTNPQAWLSIRHPSAVVKSSANYVNRGNKA